MSSGNEKVFQQILGQLTRIADALQLQQELNVEQESKMKSLMQATTRMGSALQTVKRHSDPEIPAAEK